MCVCHCVMHACTHTHSHSLSLTHTHTLTPHPHPNTGMHPNMHTSRTMTVECTAAVPSVSPCSRIGDKVPLGKKGRYGVVRGEAEALFSPYHLFVESSNAEDFADDRILQQVLGNTYLLSVTVPDVSILK